jgi:tetratricopeptide (TPR) repeat protein
LEYGKVMTDDKVDNAGTWNKIHFAYLSMKDTANAEKTLKDGLAIFPDDKALILNYINICLQQKKENVAMTYIDKAIEKDPKNPALYLVLGNIYDNQANPKDPATSKDLPKPENFEVLMTKAETNYLKAVGCKPDAFDANFNLGAVYNNWGNWYTQKADVKHPEYDKKAQEYWLKAVTYLEGADKARPCEKGVMFNLTRLYRMTSQTEKATAMSDKMKNGCK